METSEDELTVETVIRDIQAGSVLSQMTRHIEAASRHLDQARRLSWECADGSVIGALEAAAGELRSLDGALA